MIEHRGGVITYERLTYIDSANNTATLCSGVLNHQILGYLDVEPVSDEMSYSRPETSDPRPKDPSEWTGAWVGR